MIEYLSKKEVASRLGVSYRTITQWMADKRLSYIVVGGVIRFDWSRVQRDLDCCTVRAKEGRAA